MKFLDALNQAASLNLKMLRRASWPDGVVLGVSESGEISSYHVGACKLPMPTPEHLLAEDWIVVEDYGRDIGYQPFYRDIKNED